MVRNAMRTIIDLEQRDVNEEKTGTNAKGKRFGELMGANGTQQVGGHPVDNVRLEVLKFSLHERSSIYSSR